MWQLSFCVLHKSYNFNIKVKGFYKWSNYDQHFAGWPKFLLKLLFDFHSWKLEALFGSEIIAVERRCNQLIRHPLWKKRTGSNYILIMDYSDILKSSAWSPWWSFVSRVCAGSDDNDWRCSVGPNWVCRFIIFGLAAAVLFCPCVEYKRDPATHLA